MYFWELIKFIIVVAVLFWLLSILLPMVPFLAPFIQVIYALIIIGIIFTIGDWFFNGRTWFWTRR